MSKPVLLIGAGGHAAVLLDILRQLECEILGLVAPARPKSQRVFSALRWYSNDEDIFSFDTENVLLVNGVGSLPGNQSRFDLNKKFKEFGYRFMTVISPHAVVSEYAVLAEGVQIMPGSIVNANATIGDSSIINTGAIVEHDCQIGCHNHIAPRVVLSGSVITGDHVHIGTGASITQGVKIGESSILGSGAVATKNIDRNKILYPAKPFLSSRKKDEL